MYEDEMLVLTPSALLAFLTQIEELKDINISIVENDRDIQVQIGESTYTLQSPEDSVVQVSDAAVEEIDNLNEEGYSEISDLEETEDFEDISGDRVEGGIIKELIKTLAVGGLVRLTKNALMKS